MINRKQNNKPRFVLIRGLMRGCHHWGDFPSVLQHQFPGGEIMTPDIPGNGLLHNQLSPSSIPQMTEAIREQIKEKENLNLISISMGSMIALDWMNRFPQELKASVLINTSLRNYSPFYKRLRWQNYAPIFKTLLFNPKQSEELILHLTSNHRQQDSELLNHWRELSKTHPVSGLNALRQLFAAARFSYRLKPYHPTLLISSAADTLVDKQCTENIQKSWQIEHIRHDTAGHDLPLDDPAWLAKLLKQWSSNII